MEVIERPSVKNNKALNLYLPVILLTLFVALFYPTFEGLFARWIKWDESLSHGLLVNAVFIYLLFTNQKWQVQKNSINTLVFLLIGLATCSFAWWFFRAANIYILEQCLLIILLWLFYAACYGIKTAWSLRLLLLLPIFTIPVWDQLTTPLVTLSGLVVGHMVQLISLPAVIEGNSIFIPYGQIIIEDGCSGLRYFEIALALAYIISLLNNYNERKLLPALLIAACLGLAANWIRIFILVLIGYESKMSSPLMANHEFFGWLLFGVMCLPVIYWAPVDKASPKTKFTETPNKLFILLPLCILAIGPLLNFLISNTPTSVAFTKSLSTNGELISDKIMPLDINAPNNSLKEIALFENNQFPIYVQVNQYQRVVASDKLVPYIPRLYNSDEWVIIDSSKVAMQTHQAMLTIFKRKASDEKVAQLQWFQVGNYIATSITASKLLQIPALLTGMNNFKIVTLQSPCEHSNCTQVGTKLINNATDVFASSSPQ